MVGGTSRVPEVDPANLPGSPSRLLLTGHDLGFPIAAHAIQAHLDFDGKKTELFHTAEMGEDVARVLAQYLQLIEKVHSRVEIEQLVLLNALDWAKEAFLAEEDRA